jgi:hypothetical protein
VCPVFTKRKRSQKLEPVDEAMTSCNPAGDGMRHAARFEIKRDTMKLHPSGFSD